MQTTLMRRFATTLLGLAAATAAQASNPAHSGGSPTPANAIVGVWMGRIAIAPCGLPVPSPGFLASVVFHAGGTLTETNTFPLAGMPTPLGLSARNGPGMGTWRYDPQTGRYATRLRFDWWVDGVYNGYQDITQEIDLSPDGNSYTSTIFATRHAYDPVSQTHSAAVEFCGEGSSERY